MCDEWLPLVRLPLTLEQFHQLPRNATYKYEYYGGQAVLTPRAKYYHAVLTLPAPADPYAADTSEEIRVRPVVKDDVEALESAFCGAFRRVMPYFALEDEALHKAAREALRRTVTGGDGPLVEQASFVAARTDGHLDGAAFVTMLPEGDPCDLDAYYWSAPPQADLLQQRGGRPHLTWIFVTQHAARRGIGTLLLGAAAAALVELGYRELYSTFLAGNEASTLWHWRNGFRLLSYPGSPRLFRRRFRARQE